MPVLQLDEGARRIGIDAGPFDILSHAQLLDLRTCMLKKQQSQYDQDNLVHFPAAKVGVFTKTTQPRRYAGLRKNGEAEL